MTLETGEARLELPGGALVHRSAGAGPLVVLTHAFGGLAWGDLTALAGSCTVVVPDWEASTLDRRTQVTFAWFDPLVRSLGHGSRPACASWSMSGPGAIWFAAEEPPALSRLILDEVAGLGELPPIRLRDLRHLLWMRLRGRPTRGFVRMLWRGWVWQQGLDTRELEQATLRFFRANPDAYGLGAEEDDEDEDESLLDELQHIQVPTLVLAGRHSQVLGPEHGRAAVQRLPRGELVVFEESGHSLQLEEPQPLPGGRGPVRRRGYPVSMSTLSVGGPCASRSLDLSSDELAASRRAASDPGHRQRVLPGRQGTAVRLAALAELAGAGGAQFVHVASDDGSFTANLPLDQALEHGLVIYSLDGEPLPARFGGPFRLLLAEGEDCSVNVKFLASLTFVEAPGSHTARCSD